MFDKEIKDTVIVKLEGKIDSNNASDAEEDIRDQLEGKSAGNVILDMENLEYISSAGLRVILRIRKEYPDLRLVNVNSEVYEILEMTGFTSMMTVEKAYRVVSVEGCEEIGRGANGTVYRIDQDNVVKVYNNPDALADIQHEREVARLALILGVPTAISYDVVRVGEGYGSVFELLNARSFTKIMIEEPERMDWCVEEYVGMLKTIHAIEVPEGKLPDMKQTALSWMEYLDRQLPGEYADKLRRMIEDIPDDNHMIHGDYHTKNLELVGDEVLLIDMDTIAVGHPVFDLSGMYNAYIGFSELDHSDILRFQGFPFEVAEDFWHRVLESYFETDDWDKLTEIENKARILGYAKMIRRAVKRGHVETEAGHTLVEHYQKELCELLDKTDTLYY